MRLFVPPVAVLLAAALGLIIEADQVVAVLLLLLAVVGTSLLGRLAGVLASVLGAVSFNLFVTEPIPRPGVTDGDDLVALVVFIVVALVVGTLVTEANNNRRRAEQRERESQLRLELTGRLLTGESLEEAAQAAADAIVELFGMVSCTLRTGDVVATAESSRDGGAGTERVIEADQASVTVVAPAQRPLTDDDLAGLADLVAGLGTVFARVALERLATDARVEAEVSRTRAAFFAAAGHNLRTPLASVSAAVAALLDSGDRLDPEDRTELLETIRDETDRLTRMVAKVMAASRIRSGAIEPEPEPIDLQGMAQVAVRRLGPVGRDHRFEMEIPADLGPLLLDPFMVEQILLNILENAAGYAPAGSTIAVSAQRSGGDVELRVVDHGPGIPADERELVFDEFYRGGRRAESEGTGLGLAIVRSLVGAQGGTVRVEETPGSGATIVVVFPVTVAAPDLLVSAEAPTTDDGGRR
ncbi:MAG: DUF4118 domain-containing protein [Acidimicrobiia bacterium]|nr:DUF4118 domain-containing protein [Acidimicrobiia bacterium]